MIVFKRKHFPDVSINPMKITAFVAHNAEETEIHLLGNFKVVVIGNIDTTHEKLFPYKQFRSADKGTSFVNEDHIILKTSNVINQDVLFVQGHQLPFIGDPPNGAIAKR